MSVSESGGLQLHRAMLDRERFSGIRRLPCQPSSFAHVLRVGFFTIIRVYQ